MNILLADDDTDDCIFFKAALGKLSIPTKLITVHDGEKLMELLTDESNILPDVLFLDLNMPRKNGFECLAEITSRKNLVKLPVIIFSTSLEEKIVNLLYQNGARYFMRKPPEFSQLVKIIERALTLISQTNISAPSLENFVLTEEITLTI